MDGRRAELLARGRQQHRVPEVLEGGGLPSLGLTPLNRAVVERGNAIQPHHPEPGDVADYPFVLLGRAGQPPSSFLLMGDSHAMASFPGFDDDARLPHRSGLFYRPRLCPLSGISDSGDTDSLTLLRLTYPPWEHNMELILDWLENTPQIHTVFIHSRWIELANSHRDTHLNQLVADGLSHTCARLRRAGKQIVLLGPVPEWIFSPRKLMRRNALLNSNRADRLLDGDFIARQRPVFALLERMESTGLCRFVPLHGAFHKNGRWLEEDEGQLMHCDDNHLSPYGSRKMVYSIIDQVFPGVESTAAK